MKKPTHVKKVLRWGNGLAIFITKESRVLGWKEGTFIKTVVDKDSNSISIKEVKI